MSTKVFDSQRSIAKEISFGKKKSNNFNQRKRLLVEEPKPMCYTIPQKFFIAVQKKDTLKTFF